jgi:hypothetical protein
MMAEQANHEIDKALLARDAWGWTGEGGPKGEKQGRAVRSTRER